MIARFLSAAAVLATAFLFAAALPARAGDARPDVPLPPITPVDGYFVMTQDDATTSSNCIGNPVTPMCAVETVMACHVRGNDDLCRIGQGLERNSDIIIGPLPPEIYWVVRREVLTEQTLPWPPYEMEDRPGEPSVKAGDIRIDVVDKSCRKGKISHSACETEYDIPPIVAYIVRRQGSRWAVVDWRPPYNSPTLGPSGYDP